MRHHRLLLLPLLALLGCGTPKDEDKDGEKGPRQDLPTKLTPARFGMEALAECFDAAPYDELESCFPR